MEIKPVNLKVNQSWIFIGRTDAKAETPILWSPDVKNWLIGKDPNAGKDWRQEENGMTEDEMVGWHHQLDGQEFEQVPGVGDGLGSLACCSSWDCKESDMTEWLNWTEQFITMKDYRLKPANQRDPWNRIQKKICFPLSLSCGFMNSAKFPDKEVWKYVRNFCNDTSWPKSCVQNLLGLNHVDFLCCLSVSPLISRPSKDRPDTMSLKPSTRVGLNSAKRYLPCRTHEA